MNKILIAAMTSLAISAPALADKPEAPGKDKPTPEQIEARQEAAKAHAHEKAEAKAEPYRLTEEEKRAFAEKKKAKYEHAEGKHDGKKVDRMARLPKDEKSDAEMPAEKLKGKEKQQAKKAEQERKEMDKGSEQGQAARAEHSKKWWQFWKD